MGGNSSKTAKAEP